MQAPEQEPPRPGKPVCVYIWFDIEDYVTEESDDLPLVAFDILDRYGASATCKVVAEKVRVLRKRGRSDVISAIGDHDVGYHMDKHSVHPVVYEYLADKDTVEGAKEFERRETRGLREVERAFGTTASCFGHPGPAWSPHFYPAMRRMRIPVYLDETSILDLEGRPYWYCGVLNLNGANRNFVKFDYTFESPGGIAKLKEQFSEIHSRLGKEGGGFVSFLFHLHTAINKEFWDAVNFSRGKNAPKGKYVRPQAQPEGVTRRAWRDFEEMVRFISSFQDVRFVTAREALGMFRRRELTVDLAALDSALGEMGGDVRHLPVGDDYASPSELFYATASSLSSYSKDGRLPPKVRASEPLGPTLAKVGPRPRSISTRDMLRACERTVAQMDRTGRLPSSVKVPGGELATADFMATGAALLHSLFAGGTPPPSIRTRRARFLEARRIDKKSFRAACDWTVLPKGFRAPRILKELELQTWTLRPAVPSAA